MVDILAKGWIKLCASLNRTLVLSFKETIGELKVIISFRVFNENIRRDDFSLPKIVGFPEI